VHFRKKALNGFGLAALTAGLVAGTGGTAWADYGNSAVYQIEISANQTSPDGGGGAWLWIELDCNGTGYYTGSDCGHGFGSAGAASDKGDVTWTTSGGVITINGVVFNGFGGLPVTVQVPSAYGHYTPAVTEVFPSLAGILPPEGHTQVQVAP
jgi:hypothetical protein